MPLQPIPASAPNSNNCTGDPAFPGNAGTLCAGGGKVVSLGVTCYTLDGNPAHTCKAGIDGTASAIYAKIPKKGGVVGDLGDKYTLGTTLAVGTTSTGKTGKQPKTTALITLVNGKPFTPSCSPATCPSAQGVWVANWKSSS
jgi:hypothetical protein